jgi:hypothetical protein
VAHVTSISKPRENASAWYGPFYFGTACTHLSVPN